jgi:membrane fusion protein (multidrug efflux system)
MSVAEKAALDSVPAQSLPSVHEVQSQPAPTPQSKPWRQKLAVPALVLFLAAAIVVTITPNWNAWEDGRIEQVTDDAFVRGDVTPLSTKVAGILRDVNVSDFQQVHKGGLLVAPQNDDYSGQVAQTIAAVGAAKEAIEHNRRQRQLQTTPEGLVESLDSSELSLLIAGGLRLLKVCEKVVVTNAFLFISLTAREREMNERS